MNGSNIYSLFLLLLFLPGLRYFGLSYYLFLGTYGGLILKIFLSGMVNLRISNIFLLLIYVQQLIQLPSNLTGDENIFNCLIRISIPVVLILFLNSFKNKQERFFEVFFLANLLALGSLFFQFVFPGVIPLPLDGERGFITRFSTFGGNSTVLGTSLALFLPYIFYSKNRYFVG